MGIEETLEHIHAATTFLIVQNKALWEYIEKKQELKEEGIPYITPERLQAEFGICPSSARNYERKGLLSKHRFAGLVYYDKTKLLQKIKEGKIESKMAVEKGEIKNKRK